MAKLNAHALLYGAKSTQSYHQAISLDDQIRRKLTEADREIRKTLRSAAEILVRGKKVMKLATQRFRDQAPGPLALELRFLRQGSLVYGTAINPAWLPPQQVDLDDGIYVRTSFLDTDEPGLAAKKLFQLVEEALKPLCARRGWKLIQKDTCVRVELDRRSHVDLPIYAVPDDEFAKMEIAFSDASGVALNSRNIELNSALSRWKQARIDPKRVMLAHRDGHWTNSDPRSLHDHFDGLVERHGPQLRRIWRYAKGWRDFTFDVGGPSSVCLMTAVANTYEAKSWLSDSSRDDHAIAEIAKALPDQFSHDIANPVVHDAAILNDWNDAERQKNVQAARDFYTDLESALNGTYNPDITVARLRDLLGERVPDRPDLVRPESSTAIVRSVAPAAVAPLPRSRPTISG